MPDLVRIQRAILSVSDKSDLVPFAKALEARGVRVRRLESSVIGRLEVEDVLTQVTSQTRLVALASCHFIAGWRLDYARLGRELRSDFAHPALKRGDTSKIGNDFIDLKLNTRGGICRTIRPIRASCILDIGRLFERG